MPVVELVLERATQRLSSARGQRSLTASATRRSGLGTEGTTAVTARLLCSTEVILNELTLGITQDGLALTYALAIMSEQRGDDQPDWHVIYAAIIDRRRLRGLARVKKLARNIAVPRRSRG